MRFLDLYIKGFGKFHDTFLSFEDGLNIVYGKNEAGRPCGVGGVAWHVCGRRGGFLYNPGLFSVGQVVPEICG